jgi:RHS repeat-associated protein
VGRTPATFDVSATGEAQYSIPLTVPAGTRGLTPQLALVYSHRNDTSLAGHGWALAGASVIRRCHSTVVQDGVARDVRNDALDRFCLDGQKLRLESGTYGASGSSYRTEIESFARIRAYGVAGNGPAYFVVEGRDGLIYEFGNSADSRIESVGQTTARAWALSQVRDRAGNQILFTYLEDAVNGSYYLDLVRYAGNTTQGTSPAYSIDLVYEGKPAGEIVSGYLAGSLVKETLRLDRIDVQHSGGTLLRRYELAYEPALSSAGHSRLASVTECAGSPLDCLAPTSFTYQNAAAGLGGEQASAAVVPINAAWPLDVNGDGREDLVYPSTSTSGTGTWRVMLASSTGGYLAPVDTGIVNTNFSGAIPIEYNGDGRQDLLVPYSGGTWWVMLGTASGLAAPVNTGAPVTATGSGSNARALDIDGDGLEDLVWADLVGFNGGDAIRYRARLPGAAFSSTVTTLVGPLPKDQRLSAGVFDGWARRMPRRVPDFNGDGRADIPYRLTERIAGGTLSLPSGQAPQAEPAGGPGVSLELLSETVGDMGASAQGEATPDASYIYLYWIGVVCPGFGSLGAFAANSASQPYFADFNGDGLDDLLYYSSNAVWQYRFSRGTSFGPEIAGPAVSAYSPVGWVVLDWDGDGYEDLLGWHTASGTWHLVRSTGEALATSVSTGIPVASGTSTLMTLDANGDGLWDLGYRDSAGTWRHRPHTVVVPDLLATATDGFGVSTTFGYQPITNPSVHTRGTGGAWPNVDYQGGLWVVSALTTTDGRGYDSTYSLGYTYEAARINRQGRGFLGFAKRTVTDPRLGYNLRTIESYRQDYPYIGALASLERQQSSGTRISLTSHTWNALNYSSGSAARAYPYLASQSTDEHEAGGSQNGVRYRTVTTTTNALDATSGLATDVTTTTTERATGLFTGHYKTERVQHLAVSNDTANWCLGRPTLTQVTSSHTLANGAAITRSEDAAWDGPYCRPTQTRLEPGHPTLQVTTVLGYDAFGNPASQSVTGTGLAARTTTLHWGSTGRFLESVTNPLGQTTTQAWNSVLGLPASVTDPNNLSTSWGYDAFGRRTLETRPDLTSTMWSYLSCSTCDSRVRYRVVQEERTTGGSLFHTTTRYYNRWDALGWEVEQQLGSDYVYRVGRDFDARGRVTLEYVPYFAGQPTQGTRRLSYDLLDRVTSDALHTASGTVARSTGYGYAGLARTETGPNSFATTRVMGAWGALVRVADPVGGRIDYQYDAFGLLKQASDVYGNVVSAVSYNLRGMRTGLTDVNLGSWSYTPNALGEVVSQTDAKGQVTSFSYDPLGRLTSRSEAEGTSNWTWGNSSSAKNVGKLASVSGPGYSESYLYADYAGRLTRRTINADASYPYDYSYNDLGRLHTLTWPTSTAGVRFQVKHVYTNGRLTQLREFTGGVDGASLWSLNLLDAAGRAASEAYGNGLWLQSGFDPLTGALTLRKSGTGGAESNVQHLAYAWSPSGALWSRQDLRAGLTETFGYDEADRLAGAAGPGGQSLSISYDLIGNLTYRSDVGSYTYHASKKHAVVAAGSNTYAYDANGNLATRNGATLGWTSYNLPAVINAAGYSATFSYTPERRRWRQVSTYASGTETTIYVGEQMEKLTTAVRTHWKHRLPTPSGEVQVIRRSDGTTETLYLASDHLGSVDAVTNAAGTVLSRPSFNPWGGRRGSNWQGSPSQSEWQAIANTTRRGYTGHEQLDNVMLVHMNGRVYDPAIGRFLSADPFIDCAESTQGWNRYSYVKNSPLAFTDPSGYSSRGISTQPRVYRVDVGGFAIETITVTATRMDWWSRLELSLSQRTGQGGGGRASGDLGGGGGNRSGGDGSKQREEERQKCVEDCRNDYEGVIQAAAGAAGGAAGGAALAIRTGQMEAILPAAGVGLVVGGVVGAASGLMTQVARAGGADAGTASALGAGVAAPVGYTATAFAQGGIATFGGAMIGAASGATGALVPGSGGAAVSSGVSALAATQTALRARLLSGSIAAWVAGSTYQLLDVARDVYCESQCNAP